jgi:predicted transcriptional regulator
MVSDNVPTEAVCNTLTQARVSPVLDTALTLYANEKVPSVPVLATAKLVGVVKLTKVITFAPS